MVNQARLLSKTRKIGYRDTDVITLSSAQLLALDSTPITLIPAPGAGKAVFLEDYYAFLNFNSVAYTDGTLRIKYTDASGTTIVTLGTWFRGAADVHILEMGKQSAGFGVAMTENAPVVICDAGTLADGNSPIKFKLRYRIIELMT